MSPEARRLLEVAAVFDASFTVEDAALVLGESVGELRTPVQEAVDADILVRNHGLLSFRASGVRDVVYDGVTEVRRVRLHGEIGGLLSDRGEAAIAAAERAGRPAEPEALAVLDDATSQLGYSSPRAAADLAVRVLDLTPSGDDASYPRIITAVEASISAGRTEEASRLAHAAIGASATPVPVAARLRVSLADLAVMNSQAADALVEVDCVLEMAGLDDELYAAAQQTRLLALMIQGDFAPARAPAEEILGGAARAGRDGSVAVALTALGAMAWSQAHASDAIGLFRAAAERAEGKPPHLHQLRPRQSLAFMLAATGVFDEARDLLLQERQQIAAAGDRVAAIAVATLLARVYLAFGWLADAIAEDERAVALSEELASTYCVPLARATLAIAALLSDDVARAGVEVERSRAAVTTPTQFTADLCDWVEARIIAAQRGALEAVVPVAGIYAEPSTHQRLFLAEPGAAAWLVGTALAAGDRPSAEAIGGVVELMASDNEGIESVQATAAHVRGLLNNGPAAIESATELCRHPWARALALEDRGVLLTDRDRSAARADLERSLRGFGGMGAHHDAARLRDRLRDIERDGADADRASVLGDQLTQRERNVARLVAEGLTNRQVAERLFLSRHTVDFHLRQVFRKLGINSRVELVARALEEDDRR